jgi:heme/copper-type cytochrome/quinol oxidase subunit 4
MAAPRKQRYFPKNTDQWHFEEPTALRRFSLSLVEMAVLTGIALRLYRALVITHGSTSWAWIGGTFVFGLLLLCAMATMHLASYPLHRWTWRAPLFALVEVAAESVTSLLLIYLGREPKGSARAVWSDWLPMTFQSLWTRELTVCGWALILAGAVWVVRRTVLRDEPVQEETPEEIAKA